MIGLDNCATRVRARARVRGYRVRARVGVRFRVGGRVWSWGLGLTLQ